MTLVEILDRPGLCGTSWSVRLRAGAGGAVVAEHEPHRRLPTASVGKVLLLLEVASRIDEGSLSPGALLSRRALAPVADSGLWQHLTADEISVADAATLVGSVSDNLATNVLIEAAGLEAIAERGRSLGLVDSVLHDLVRAERTPEQPSTLSEGTAGEWCDLLLGVHARAVAPPAVCERVLGWLSTCTDHSMVAGALGLDPLSHGVDRTSRPRLWSKTGTDDGIRADVGILTDGDAAVAYAALCSWEPGAPVEVRDVLRAMRDIGDACADALAVP